VSSSAGVRHSITQMYHSGNRTSATSATENHAGSSSAATEQAGDQPDAEAAPGWQLVAAAQRGDQDAFGRLYDRYVDVVYRYALLRVGDRSLAEDLTSETFLRALRNISSISYQGRDVGAWFVTIARNLVLDHVKSSRFRLEVATAEVDDSRPAESGPEQQVLSKVTRTALLECVGQLGDDQRECIVLRFLQGLSVAETAKVMARNEGAVKALQHRALAALRRHVDRRPLGT
jgi:RNA polymerase sigma-70 factor (ECF subfamily)